MRINQSKIISWYFFSSYASKKAKNDNTIKTEKWIVISQQALNGAIKELKTEENRNICSYPEIKEGNFNIFSTIAFRSKSQMTSNVM